jgi:large subunit ribosomal protein L10
MAEKHKAKASQLKKDAVKNAKQLIEKYKVVAVVNMKNLTAKQLQNMRAQLRERVDLFMTKKRLIKLALEDGEAKKKGVSKLIDSLRGMPALLCSNDNPFILFKILKKNKSSAPIKAGQVATSDIIVPAGPTGFAPGPIIGELGVCKIKAGINAGKVVIKEDSLVAKEGDVISKNLAAVLLRLGIEPLEIGLDLIAAYENGNILDKSILDIDEEKYISGIKNYAAECFNLAMFVAHPTKDTIHHLVTKAARHAKGLAKHAKIVNKETVKEILSGAHASVVNVHSKLPKEAK